MTGRLRRYVGAAQRAIERHGGGWRGLLAVVLRSLRVLRAMGLKGFLGRLQSAGSAPPLPPASEHAFPPPAALAQVDLRIAVMAHVFYPDLAAELAKDLAHMPLGYELLVSVVNAEAAETVQRALSGLPHQTRLQVRVVPNRGRDIAPLLVAFREEVLQCDLICHVHTKKSLYTGHEQVSWRRYLLSSLFGSHERLAWIFGMFQAEPRLGMVYPESFPGMPLWAHTLLSNAQVCAQLAARLGFSIDSSRYLDFPAGSMFWARVDALRPLYELGLTLEDFPEEHGQVDGTLQHAVERLLACTTQQQGRLLGILPQTGELSLATEGERNWASAFELDLANRIRLSAVEADLVSFDVFDTLVTRPFLTAHGARAHLAFLAARQAGVENFAPLRARAEDRARIAMGRDPTLDEIYAAMAELSPQAPSAALQAMEIAHEAAMLKPRDGVLAALAGLRGKRLAALSDMYLPAARLKQVLPAAVVQAFEHWWISCESGWRKDAAATWPRLGAREGVAPARWLHVGDNEHADIQIPQLQGLLTPVHVLRPAALLDVVPALRPLRHRDGQDAAWPEQLWRGLVANRLANLADRTPDRILPRTRLDAESAGYTMLGPLVLDYLAWLHGIARSEQMQHVLFLSREGHLLARAYEIISAQLPEAQRVPSHYFLASRRATGFPTLRSADDLPRLLAGSYNGRLDALLLARFGEPALAAAAGLGESLKREVYLPEMKQEVVAWLQPALPRLLRAAEEEREAYLRYWQTEIGDLSATVLVADVGYAGSIQMHLSRMVGHPLGGAYLALRHGARQLDAHGWAQARHHDGRTRDDEDSVILRHDLLLEAMLTAPHGQFSRFRSEGGKLLPEFTPAELGASGVETLERLHAGAIGFVRDACATVGPHIDHLQLEPEGVVQPLRCLAEGRWQDDGWLAHLVTEDAFTGRGRIVPGR
ncbi:MAG TPA: rhamnan synthesis F family protein [Stenotrophomonas sp.]|nr:rhamnan synthesis F family protein [Stenotrophomonas sp.]